MYSYDMTCTRGLRRQPSLGPRRRFRPARTGRFVQTAVYEYRRASNVAYGCSRTDRDMYAGSFDSNLWRVVHDGDGENIDLAQSLWGIRCWSCRPAMRKKLPLTTIKLAVTVCLADYFSGMRMLAFRWEVLVDEGARNPSPAGLSVKRFR